MTRVPNWDIALHQWAADVVGRPYVWGETDCGSLVREAHALMYGVDLFHVKPYTTRRQALYRHNSTGGVEAVLREAGAVDVPVAFAQQGDVLCEAEGDGLPACGVVVGRSVIWATVEDGVARTPLRGRSGTLLRVPHG